MAKIVFMCDLEEGHLIPTFGLASSLKRRGHDIYYLSVADNEKLIRDMGFAFYPVLEDIYPKGFRQAVKQSRINKAPETYLYKHAEVIIKDAYDKYVNEIKADLYLVNVILAFDILVLYYKYGIKAVTLTAFRNRVGKTIASDCLSYITSMTLAEKCCLLELFTDSGKDFTSFHEVVEPLTEFHEMRIWPGELEINTPPPAANIHYTEPSIRKVDQMIDVYEAYSIPTNKKIIYASMGTQALRHGVACDLFFGKALHMMKSPEFSELHLILCIDKEYDMSKLGEIPDNVTILNWAPQLNILKVASVAIIHGGLGSVKECIYYGVPMIVFPQGYDQPSNARCVAHHKLGFASDIQTITETDLKSYIIRAIQDKEIREAIQSMKKQFQQQEKNEVGAGIIENMLEVREPHAAFVKSAL